MKRSSTLLLAAAVVLGALLAAWFLGPSPDTDPLIAEPGATAPPTAAAEDPEPAAPADKPATRVPRPERVQPVRRVVPPPPQPDELDEAEEGVGDAVAEAEHDGPVDKRDKPTGDSKQLLEDIKAGMDQVSDDISDCIQSWAEVSPDFEGRVVMRFQLDADGLQDVWIEEYQDVPAGPLTCFGAAVYEVDWADITDDPLEVSFPFEVTTGDTGG